MQPSAPVILELQLPSRTDVAKLAAQRRRESVKYAIRLGSGPTQEDRRKHVIYTGSSCDVIAEKPGKEAAPDYIGCRFKDGHRGRNENDMRPDIIREHERPYKAFSFDDVFRILDRTREKSAEALELLACLLFRMAFMLDHEKSEDGLWLLTPPQHTLSAIRGHVQMVDGVPVDVFLYLAEVIALNEDVKYHTLGYNPELKNAAGRRNNLLTYCRLCAVLLHRESFHKFVSGFTRPPVGISPLAETKVHDFLPLLEWGSAERSSLL